MNNNYYVTNAELFGVIMPVIAIKNVPRKPGGKISEAARAKAKKKRKSK